MKKLWTAGLHLLRLDACLAPTISELELELLKVNGIEVKKGKQSSNMHTCRMEAVCFFVSGKCHSPLSSAAATSMLWRVDAD